MNYQTFIEDYLSTSAIIAGIFISLIIILTFAIIEERKKLKLIFELDVQSTLVIIPVITFITILLMFILSKGYDKIFGLIGIISIIIKFIFAIYGSIQAKKLGRNSIIWFFLSFIEYHISFFVLALRPALIEKTDLFALINKLYSEKIETLKNLKINTLINEQEYHSKQLILRKQYFEEINESRERIDKTKKTIKKEDINANLHKAFEDGILTKEELNSKLNDI